MNILKRHLTLFFVLLFIVAPIESTLAQTDKKSLKPPIITCSYKTPPPGKKTDRQSAASRQADAIKVVTDSNAKKKPRRSQKSSAPVSLKRLTSENAIIMDALSGDILYAKSPDQPRQPASTIKVLTGLIALEALNENDKVPVSRRAARMPRSKIWLDQRKTYYASDLIDAVLLASANDASVALAEKIAGSERAFARLMTRKALKLGARKTICKTASGLTRRGQCSTVRDLAIIFNKAMNNQEFAERVGRTKIKTRAGKILRNHNKALWRISGAEGGKTGYTWAARQTYVGKFKRGQDALVVAIMGSDTMWKDIRNLVEYGFSRKQQLRLAENKVFSTRRSLEKQKRSSTNKPVLPFENVITVLVGNKKVAHL